MEQIRVAIDGPAGAGKSTVAKRVANELGLPYIDTGAMYRAVTWKALQQKVNLTNDDQITDLAARLLLSFEMKEGKQIVYADGQDITEHIRSQQVTELVSRVAAIPGVRVVLVKMQQRIAKQQGVVMDGRDIGTYVIPDAEVKIFLTASLEERARRRMQEMGEKGVILNLSEMETSLAKRDELDSTREFSPLRQAKDAHVIDTTGKSIQEVVNNILLICHAAIGTKK